MQGSGGSRTFLSRGPPDRTCAGVPARSAQEAQAVPLNPSAGDIGSAGGWGVPLVSAKAGGRSLHAGPPERGHGGPSIKRAGGHPIGPGWGVPPRCRRRGAGNESCY
jgi:hypothetical protein